MTKLCECGCQMEVKPGKRFRHGHYARTPEAAKARKGKGISLRPNQTKAPTLNDPLRQRTSSEREARRSELEARVKDGMARRYTMHPIREADQVAALEEAWGMEDAA